MNSRLATVDVLLSLVKSQSLSGTTLEISTLSISVAEASASLDKATMADCRQQLEAQGIGSKVFSKLKVIGETLLQLNEHERGELVKRLPPSYGTIHVLCRLKPQELLTAAKTGAISKSLSIRAATAYVKQVRFPKVTATEASGNVRWSLKNEHVFSIYRPEEKSLEPDQRRALEKALSEVCKEFGVEVRPATAASANELKRSARAERENYWRQLLERNLSSEWFLERPEEVRKQFNLKAVHELHNAPLRTFTGFIHRGDGGKATFWEKHGQNYVAKVHMEMEKTEDHAQRYNLKRRLEEILGDRTELAIWSNRMLKDGGYT